MDINGDSDSTITRILNDNIVLSNNYSGCNINYSVNYLISNNVPIN